MCKSFLIFFINCFVDNWIYTLDALANSEIYKMKKKRPSAQSWVSDKTIKTFFFLPHRSNKELNKKKRNKRLHLLVVCWRNQEISSLLREMGLGTSLAWGSGLGECRGAFYGGVFFFLWDFAARGCKYQSAVPILFIIIYLNILSCWFHWQQLLGQIFFFFFKCTGPSGGNPRFPFCGQIKNKKQKKQTNQFQVSRTWLIGALA